VKAFIPKTMSEIQMKLRSELVALIANLFVLLIKDWPDRSDLHELTLNLYYFAKTIPIDHLKQDFPVHYEQLRQKIDALTAE
jgi:hypothetical protein